jgi:cyclic pyranopterin monophosphate synthase
MTVHKSIEKFFENSSFRMINIGDKKPSQRKAIAMGKIFINPEVIAMIESKTLAKGDVITLAEIAGINGAKATATLLPLCHPLPLDNVLIKNQINREESCIEVFCFVAAFAKTGVEMEAMAGVQAALLCIYDLCKMYGHEMCLSEIRLLYKVGGKSHKICYPEHLPKMLAILAETEPKTLNGINTAILVISDRVSKGIYEDKSGMLLQSTMENNGAQVVDYQVVPDEKTQIMEMLQSMVQKNQPDIICTTGGTGVGPRDVTPEAIRELIKYEIPGLGELLRIDGATHTPFSWLSRSIVGLYENTLIISFPGSGKAVSQGVEALHTLLPHLLNMIKGETHDSLS